jgi:hypothetical protein
MQVVHARCRGLDVHKETVVACVLLTDERGRVTHEAWVLRCIIMEASFRLEQPNTRHSRGGAC